MAALGSLAPSPRHVGGGTSRVAAFTEAINGGMGTAYDVQWSSPVYLQSLAIARLIAVLWSCNERMRNLWHPALTDFLARWERIFGLTPSTADSKRVRRGRLAAAWRALGGPVYGTLQDMGASLLGAAFVGVEYTPLADDNAHWPGNGEPDGWSSNIAHIVVRVLQPGTVLDPELFALFRQLGNALDLTLPAWATWDWAMNGAAGDGFYLDTDRALDFMAFD